MSLLLYDSWPNSYNGFCACGRRLVYTGEGMPRNAIYNTEGGLIYAECAHGVIIIDKRTGTV